MPVYPNKPVHELLKEMIEDLRIKKGDVFTIDQVKSWFQKHYPLVRPGTVELTLTAMTTNVQSRLQYHPNDKDVFFKIEKKIYRLYEPGQDPSPIR